MCAWYWSACNSVYIKGLESVTGDRVRCIDLARDGVEGIEGMYEWLGLDSPGRDQVQEIIELNKNNELAIPLEDYESEIEEEVQVDFENVVGQDSLTRFDVPKKSKRRNRRNRNKKKVPAGGNPNQPKAKNKQQGQNKQKNQNKGQNQNKQQGQKQGHKKPQNQKNEQGQKRQPKNNNRRRNSKPNGNRNQKE